MATKAESSPETENLENSNDHSGRRCPKCGTLLGQKNLCPVCDSQKEANPEARNDSATTTEESARGITHMDRFQQYQQLKQSLADNPTDFLFVLRTVRTIQRDYADYLPLDYISFYAEMYRAKCPFAVFVALMVPEWNILYRRILKTEWDGSNCARLYASPLSWMYLLLGDEKMYVDDFKETADYMASQGYGSNADNIRRRFMLFMHSFGAFFNYSFNPVTFLIWGVDYLDLMDASWNRGNPAKPIKLISVYGQIFEGWQEIVPAGKRVLILFCGTEIEVGGSAVPSTPANEESGQSEQGASQSGERHIFETYDGLQFQQRKSSSVNLNAIEHTLLYLVEP